MTDKEKEKLPDVMGPPIHIIVNGPLQPSKQETLQNPDIHPFSRAFCISYTRKNRKIGEKS